MMRHVLGATIGTYVVRARLATGGMGSVYLAEHTTLDKRVAIKVLLPEMSVDRTTVTRLFNEARATSAIHHPSIVEIFDFGYTPDGQAYIVMELLDGESLSARLRRGRMDLRRAMLFARQIAGGLAAAHERGIVHRDLKPDNVFVVPDPEVPGGERVKLLDFGIAKVQKGLDDKSLTQAGTLLGTPTYMAPEQCRGASAIDARADLYALGCVLYELLVGRPPFTHDGAADVLAHHLYFEPQPPRELEPRLPEQVEQLVLWLLRKDPAQRPQSARDLVAAIDRTGLGSDPLAAPPPSSPPIATVPVPTTLTGASGIKTPTPLHVPRPRRWVVPVVAGLGVAAGVAIYFAIASGQPAAAPVVEPAAPAPAPAPPPPAPVAPVAPAPAPAKPASVKLAIDSEPSGASVLVDGKQVGTTPYADTVDAAGGSRTYTVQKAGYVDATATLPTDRDGTRTLVLEKKKPAHRSHSTKNPGLGDRGVNPFD